MAPSPPNNLTILCVDDDASVLDSYRQVLLPEADILDALLDDNTVQKTTGSQPAYNLLLAKSGEEAVNIVQEQHKEGNRIAAGFFDIRMPGGMDGYETIREIRKVDPEIYCAVVTAYTDRNPNIIRALFGSKHQDHFLYFNKPFSALPLEQTALNLVTSWNSKEAVRLHLAQMAHSENSLRQSKERFQNLTDMLPIIVYEIDLMGEISFINRCGIEMFGYSEKEIGNGINYLDMIAPNDRDRARENLRQRANGQDIGPVEYQALRKDSTAMAVLAHTSNIIKDETLVGFRGVLIDITKRKLAEKERADLQKQFRQAQKMEAIGTLAGGIAHDFNNILSAIMGYSELTQILAGENREIHQNLDEVLKAAGRARDLVKQILTFSRQNEQTREPLQIYLIVNEALQLLRASIPSTIEFREDIRGEEGIIKADATQIHQIVMNLCTNAYHAMRASGGGVLTVELSEIHLEKEQSIVVGGKNLQPGQYMKLLVRDTGTGIDPANIDRVFDPYFTTKPTGEGTGMGLALIHGIVESYNGKIALESEIGKGTTFEIYLPCHKNDNPIDFDTEVNEGIKKGSERILLIDDEQTIVEMEQQMLARLGYHVTMFSYCDRALQVFFAHPESFDLIITDLSMPQMNGLELAEEIHDLRPDLPIILCTGFSEAMTKEKAESLGIEGILMKPISLTQLSSCIRKIMDGR